MAIEFITVPGAVELSRNRFHVHVRSDVYSYSPAGAKAKLVISGLDGVSSGAITLTSESMGSGGPSFSFSSSPSTYQIRIYNSTLIGSIETWIDEYVLPVLLSHPFMQDYTAYRDGEDVVIEAREVGGTYTLDPTVPSPATPTNTFGFNDALIDLKIRMRVNLIDIEGNVIQSPWQMFDVEREQVGANVYGRVNADLGSVLNGMMRDVFSSDTITAPVTVSNNRAFVEVVEHYVTELVPDPWKRQGYRTSLNQVLKGASLIHDMSETFTSNFVTTKRFITNRPDVIYVYPDQRDFLWYYHELEYTAECEVRVVIYYTDGEEALQVIDTYTASTHVLRCVPTSFVGLGLDALEPTREAYMYEIYVVKSTGAGVIFRQTFRLLDYDDSRGELQYFNSYGLMESLPLEGDHSYEISHTSKKASVKRDNIPTRSTLTEITYDNNSQTEITIQSIPMTSRMWEGYKDIIHSSSVMYRRTGSYTRLAANIVPGSIQFVPVSNGADIGNIKMKISLNKETGGSVWSRNIS